MKGKSVAISGNVKTIGVSVFNGCKTPDDITTNNLVKVGKNAFIGIKKGAVVENKAHYIKLRLC